MTRSEWDACTDPAALLHFLCASGPVSERKLRQFAVACCRRIWPLLTDPRSREAIEVAERYADGRAEMDELRSARKAADGAVAEVTELSVPPAENLPWAAADAARAATGYPNPDFALAAARFAAEARGLLRRPSDVAPERRMQAAVLRCLFGPVRFRAVYAEAGWFKGAAAWSSGSPRRSTGGGCSAGCPSWPRSCRRPGASTRTYWATWARRGRTPKGVGRWT